MWWLTGSWCFRSMRKADFPTSRRFSILSVLFWRIRQGNEQNRLDANVVNAGAVGCDLGAHVDPLMPLDIGGDCGQSEQMAAVGRNDPCPCGSGLKYKRCCLLKSQQLSWKSRVAIVVISAILLIGAIVTLSSLGEFGEGCPLGQVWSAEHGHCH
jgi:hypothetical protein